ncbi:MAG: transglycosylase SLT domain-containing protein [Deltaproteobacteria bacterium]|nr:transglycosylase SLT domain-containing protein [Deltaproteobacteria bacterium]
MVPEPSFIGPATKPEADAPSPNGPITSPTQVDVGSPGKASNPFAFVVPEPSFIGPITSPSQVDVPSPVGPITSPSQVDAIPPAASVQRTFATSEHVRRFDSVYSRYRGGIPIEYVRALVELESAGNPDARSGEAIGLMQIRPVLLADYNKRHGTSYASAHLTDPSVNVAIGCDLLRQIIDSYRRNHPAFKSLQRDWNNPRFVELLTLGWSAGFAETGGVGFVAKYAKQLDLTDVSIELIRDFAPAAGADASEYLRNPARIAWCKRVASLYARERALARHT